VLSVFGQLVSEIMISQSVLAQYSTPLRPRVAGPCRVSYSFLCTLLARTGSEAPAVLPVQPLFGLFATYCPDAPHTRELPASLRQRMRWYAALRCASPFSCVWRLL